MPFGDELGTPRSPKDGRRQLTPNPGPSLPAWLTLLVLLGLGLLWRLSSSPLDATEVDYSQFYTWLEDGKVETVALQGDRVHASLKREEPLGQISVAKCTTRVPEDPELILELRKHGVAIKVLPADEPLGVVGSLLPWVVMIGLWVWLSRRSQQMLLGSGPLSSVVKGKSHRFRREEAPPVTFSDVAGMKSAKRDLEEIVGFLKAPEQFRRLGARVPRGALLVGPPGTGKTLLARAVAGEAGVPFFSITASEFIELFVGVGASRVRELFAEARKEAPAIIFIDEIDAVGRSRGAGLGGGNDEREQTLNQLLAEMDGFAKDELTIVLAATNRPDVLDPALLRPGRFDRRVLVERPEREARRSILDVHVRGKPLGPDVDLDVVAADTPGFSGADLANLANEAALAATRRGAQAIARQDFTLAYDKILLGEPREGRLSAPEKHRVAVHESGHALVAHLSEHAEPLRRISILPRGMALGVTQQVPPEDRHLQTQPELLTQLRILMGGYAAERVVLGEISSGATSDLQRATELAFKMVAHFGMSERVGPVYHEHKVEHAFLGQRLATEGGTSDATVNLLEEEVRSLLRRVEAEAEGLITQHRQTLDALVRALGERESLEAEELEGIVGKRPAAATSGSPSAAERPTPG